MRASFPFVCSSGVDVELDGGGDRVACKGATDMELMLIPLLS